MKKMTVSTRHESDGQDLAEYDLVPIAFGATLIAGIARVSTLAGGRG